MEIRRRHPEVVRLYTFSKPVEAKNGADWEWHVVGRRRTLKMRVQAKRLQRNGVLKVRHKVKSSGKQQRDLLIDSARAAKMKPVYCIYCSEPQREVWKQPPPPRGYRSFELGCLLADAAHVLETTKRLNEIEEKCRPWHHLFLPAALRQAGLDYFLFDADDIVRAGLAGRPLAPLVKVDRSIEQGKATAWHPPTVDDLNEETDREFDRCGVAETTAADRARLEPDMRTGHEIARIDEARLRELGISRMMVFDVRDTPESHKRRRQDRTR